MSVRFQLKPGERGMRIDRALAARLADFSRTAIQAALSEGALLVDGRSVKPSLRLNGGEVVEGSVESSLSRGDLLPEKMALKVLYEDASLIAVNKPAGMAVHPGAGRKGGTLANALLYRLGKRLSDTGGPDRPGIVHRLDKDTTGVILAAKSNRVHARLAGLFRDRAVKKTYHAIVWGEVRGDGVIDGAIGRCHADPTKMRVDEKGRSALTRYTLVKSTGAFSELVIHPETGRTHQIRVHLSSIGHPVAGDVRYGGGREWVDRTAPLHKAAAAAVAREAKRPMLHAGKVEFVHPVSRKKMVIRAPLPEDYKKIREMVFGA